MLFVASIEIDSLSPLILSGVDTSRADNVFRLTSLRGVVEWVFRALIAAVAILLHLDEKDVSSKIASCVFGGENFSIYRSRYVLLDVTDYI